jgi:hypothetical protein
MTQVKIVKCTQKSYWYKNCIGQVFDVLDDDHDQWYIPMNNELFFIRKEDTVLFNRRQKINKIISKI